MRRPVVCIAAVLIFFIVAFLVWRLIVDAANPWIIRGDTFCNKRYSVCVSNEPNWIVDMPQRNSFHRSNSLLAFTAPSDASDPQGFAHVVITPVENATWTDVSIIKPLVYLQKSIKSMKRDYFRFEAIKPPSVGFVNGKEVGIGQFISAVHSDDNPVIITFYAFLSGGKGCRVMYFVTPNQLHKTEENAMCIVKSFKFDTHDN